ncbi:MAG: RNA polymerase sigma factor [Candidatus Zixiibacteriota bacterium]|nr:MAG: RNA polymerase sigma factor [candidate division Zixibacteria bacterium]
MEHEQARLVIRAQAGDREAFNELVRANKDKMFTLIYRMTGDREAAQDLVQETFLTAFKGIGNFRGAASFSGWLYRIASNKTLNYLRRAKLVSFLPLGRLPSAEPSDHMTDGVHNDQLKMILSAAQNALPPKQKLVFYLRFYQELSFADIADILGRSESTAKTHYHKAVEKLRKRLKEFL